MLVGRHNVEKGVVIQETMKEEEKILAVGIDAGSTETRVAIADKAVVDLFCQPSATKQAVDTLMTTYRIPSSAVLLEQDHREILPVSKDLSDNYDSIIIMVETKAANPMFSTVRMLRGRKMTDTSGAPIQYFDSSSEKMGNALFYLNILDGIGYAVLQKYSGKIPKKIIVNLSVSVRPKELGTATTKKMRDNLLGKFIFRWRSVSIDVTIANILFTTEPEAQITGTQRVFEAKIDAGMDPTGELQQICDKFDNSSCYMHIEGGGSSIGVELIRDGSIVGSASTTMQLGGDYLTQVVSDRIRENEDLRVSRDAVRQATITGLLRNGRSSLDVSTYVDESKKQLARTIMEGVRHEVIDIIANMTMRDIEFISLGGRLFWPDDTGSTPSTYFAEFLKKQSPETELIVLHDNFIPQGNMLVAIDDNLDVFDVDIDH